MTNETLLERNIQAFQGFLQQQSLTIVDQKEIQSGYQFKVTDGRDKITVSFFSTGKALVQGKACNLQTTIQAWWQTFSFSSSPAIATTELANPTSPPTTVGRLSRFYVAPDHIDRVKSLLQESGGRITEPTADPHQIFRADLRHGAEKVTALQFKTGTLTVQGRTGELFEETCRRLEEVLSQPFAERGARYVPETERASALEYLNKPEAEREALDWTNNHLGQEVYDFLPSNEREGYISGASVLLWLKTSSRRLSDYSTIVMPFARAYEGFVIQLAMRLGITTEADIEKNVEQMKAGAYLNQVKEQIERTDRGRYAGLADTLQSAWRDIRNKVLHSDPLNPPPHRTLTHAEQDIATLNRAMHRGYEYLVERGIIAPKAQQSASDDFVVLSANCQRLREELVKNAYAIKTAPGAEWIAELGDTKVVCPDSSKGQVKVYGSQRTIFQQNYAPYIIQDSDGKQASTPEVPISLTTVPQPTGLARIGLDESGKGDYFGPLVIGGVHVDEQTELTLIQMGVRDSKKISDSRIQELAQAIKQLCPHSVVHIGPKRYNELYDDIGNLNELLAWGHARALENVLGSANCNLAVADQFGSESFLLNALLKKGKQIKLEQRPKGEQDTAVAAASILARAEFLQSMDRLSRRAGKKLPRGSSDPLIIPTGREIVGRGGKAALAEFAKLHFKTTQAIIKK
jgi:ribonuclease HIII